MGRYLRPSELGAATEALAEHRLTILSGGTDFYPARVGRAIAEDVLDISAIAELHGHSDTGEHWRLGALMTWSDLIEAHLPRAFDGLKAAAREIGGRQVQNMGTLAGNLCNASPAADGTPNLMALEAEVELKSRAGLRRVAISQFVIGNRKTTRAADEIVTAILVPKRGGECRAAFKKLGARRYLVISIAMVAAVLERSSAGLVARARIAVGSCHAVAQRLPTLEVALEGKPWHPAIRSAILPEHLTPLAPIDDVRATADYRREAARTLIADAIDAIVAKP